jgi:hypothetical protein
LPIERIGIVNIEWVLREMFFLNHNGRTNRKASRRGSTSSVGTSSPPQQSNWGRISFGFIPLHLRRFIRSLSRFLPHSWRFRLVTGPHCRWRVRNRPILSYGLGIVLLLLAFSAFPWVSEVALSEAN